jgi:hypothetical protein
MKLSFDDNNGKERYLSHNLQSFFREQEDILKTQMIILSVHSTLGRDQ